MADDLYREICRRSLHRMHSKRRTVSSTIANKSRELIGNGWSITNCVPKSLLTARRNFLWCLNPFELFIALYDREQRRAGSHPTWSIRFLRSSRSYIQTCFDFCHGYRVNSTIILWDALQFLFTLMHGTIHDFFS